MRGSASKDDTDEHLKMPEELVRFFKYLGPVERLCDAFKSRDSFGSQSKCACQKCVSQ